MYFILFLIDIKINKCGRVVSDDPFLIVYYITQKTCNEAVDDSIATLKLIPDWFVKSKMIKKNFTALYIDENILNLLKVVVMPYLIVMEQVFLI